MLKAEQILDEVVEATAWAMCDDINGEGAWDETPFRYRPMWRSAARASIAAAINAWPGARLKLDGRYALLPLPQEPRDE